MDDDTNNAVLVQLLFFSADTGPFISISIPPSEGLDDATGITVGLMGHTDADFTSKAGKDFYRECIKVAADALQTICEELPWEEGKVDIAVVDENLDS